MKELLLPHVKSGVVALALAAGIAVSGTGRAANSDALIGNWKLVSWQVVVGNETQNPFGQSPKGYLLLTREGRAMAITTADNRKAGDGVAERAALHKSMLAYSGRYRVEGDDFITTVDISWNEIWNGTEQRRHYRLEGDRLFIESAPAPSILYPGKTDFRRIVWEREK
ncbi:Lipocalin-like domain-containing protein [Bradyrhizobium lablabi]|uniref:Lipocalin-like domain-containing protein n=1 Tax=Bradyrhizobium lablabi TaxID=722472 RepID=A0A1M6ZLT1_9BRAD|nr:lipocalin-like domain-containing protein [Bradyrhizobium lablabi]SHL31364.1 Lipocalin-like domain-containing protein [Bradyrhizobium lablabi]